jgi:hypothetical protein
VNDLRNGPDTGPDRVRKPVTHTEPWADYQRRVVGSEEYRLTTESGKEIWADGVHLDPDGVAAVDAKFVEQPGGRSMYEGGRPEFLYETLDGEFERYAVIVRDSSNPVSRLRIVASTPEAAKFLEARARATMGPDIDIVVVVQQ